MAFALVAFLYGFMTQGMTQGTPMLLMFCVEMTRMENIKHGWRAEVHVYPTLDLKEHVLSEDCWCTPTQDDENPNIIIHNAADGREKFETKERLPS